MKSAGLMLFLMLMLCSCLCANAQTLTPAEPITTPPAVVVMYKLTDGSFVLTIDGKQYRAFDSETVRELAKAKVDRESLTEIVAALKDQVKALEAIKTIDEKILADKDKLIANKDAEIANLDGMLTSANDMAFKAMDLAAGYQRAAKTGRVVAVLNSPYFKVFSLIIPPLLTVLSK